MELTSTVSKPLADLSELEVTYGACIEPAGPAAAVPDKAELMTLAARRLNHLIKRTEVARAALRCISASLFILDGKVEKMLAPTATQRSG